MLKTEEVKQTQKINKTHSQNQDNLKFAIDKNYNEPTITTPHHRTNNPVPNWNVAVRSHTLQFQSNISIYQSKGEITLR